jgi:hypothetical protein
MKTLLFHEGDESLQGIVVVVELVSSGVELQLPVGEHDLVVGVLEGGFGDKELVTTGARQIDADGVEEAKAAGGSETVHGVGLGADVEELLLNEESVRGEESGKEGANIVFVMGGVSFVFHGGSCNRFVPDGFQISTEGFASLGVELKVLEVQHGLNAGTRELMENTNETLLVGGVRGKDDILFTSYLSLLVRRSKAVDHTGGGVVFVKDGCLERQWGLFYSLKLCDGGHG